MISLANSDNSLVLATSLLNVLCWGTWGILGKLAEPVDSMVFASDFVLGQMIGGFVYFFTLGMAGTKSTSTEALMSTPVETGLGIALGGIFVCMSNTLVSKAGTLVGVSVAFPMCMGAGLVGGSALNYILQPESTRAEWLFTGIACAALASCLGGVAERLSPYASPTEQRTPQPEQAMDPENGAPHTPQPEQAVDPENGVPGADPENLAPNAVPGKYILTHDGVIVSALESRTSKELATLAKNCIVEVNEIVYSKSQERIRAHIKGPVDGWISLVNLVDQYKFATLQPSTLSQTASVSFKHRALTVALAGLLSALWSPVASFFIVRGKVDAFTSIFYFNWGQIAALVMQVLTRSSIWHPFDSLRETSQLIRKATWQQHILCLAAGLLNVSGILCNFLAGSASSFAQAFGIAMCAPVVTTIIGIIALGELKGRTTIAKGIVATMCVSYLGGIAFIANSAA